jgi:hypothetical protein
VSVAGTAMPGLRRGFGGRPGLLVPGASAVAAGPLCGPAVDPRVGSLAILENLRASMAKRTP